MSAPVARDGTQARAWLELLIANLKELKRMTEDYPVYLLYGGRGYVFRSERDIDELTAALLKELEDIGEDVSSFRARLQHCA